MQSVTVQQTLRPNKIVIIIPKGDKKALLKAIEVNTFFWGGRYNPIIELPKKSLVIKNEIQSVKYTPKQIIEGYLRAYNPDFILPINLEENELKGIDFGDRKIIHLNEGIFSINFKDKGSYYCYGTTLYEVLDYIYKTDLKFQRSDGTKACFAIPNSKDLFIASLFGYLGSDKFSPIKKSKFYKIAEKITKENYIEYLKYPTLNKLTIFDIKTYHNNLQWNNGAIFVMNSKCMEDIVSFWNLRASTLDILPVDINIAPNNKILKEFIELYYYKEDYSEHYNTASLIFSKNISKVKCDKFWEELQTNLKSKVSLQGQPVIWLHKNVAKYNTDYKFKELTINNVSEQIKFETIKPNFFNKNKFGEHRFCNEIKFLPQVVNNRIIAKIFPEKFNKDLLSGIMLNERRLSNSTINVFSNNTAYFDIPDSDMIFIRWLKNQGWKAKTGSISQLIKRVISFFDNPYYLNILNNFSDSTMLALLQELGSKELSEKAVRARINEFLKRNQLKKFRFKENADNVLSFLIKRNIIKLGYKIQCPICNHKHWHSIDDTKYRMNCQTCLSDYDLPTQNPKELEYAYKAIGPFACNKNESNGIYTPLLTLNFFNELKQDKTTAVFNVEAEKDNKKIEFDLALFIEEEHRFDNQQLTIFCECKTHNDFQKLDIERMKFLTKEFPESIIVFSTQNEALSKSEIKLIGKFKEYQDKLKQKRKQYSPIIILTANELILNDNISYKQNWETLTDKHKRYSEEHCYNDEVKNLAVKTCNLYLNSKN